MAKTANQVIELKDNSNAKIIAFPVASGETIYQGTVAGVDTTAGLLYDLDATIIGTGVGIAAIVGDDSINITGPAATTAAGSISGVKEAGTAAAGDKTVRNVYTKGIFKLPYTSATQAICGSAVYASDNFTFTTTAGSNQWIGTIVAVIGTTHVYVDLNESYAI